MKLISNSIRPTRSKYLAAILSLPLLSLSLTTSATLNQAESKPQVTESNNTNTDTSTNANIYIEHTPLDCLIEPHMIVSVGSPSTGIIDRIPVKRGDTVKQNNLIAQLDNSLEKNAIKVAEERRNFLENKYKRTLELKNQKMTTTEAFEQSITELSIAELELRRRKIQYQQKSVKSPVKGIVLERLLAPGEYAYEQTPILKIAQTDPLNAEVIAPIDLYNQIGLEQKAEITIKEPINDTFTAEVEVIDKVFDTASGTFGVRLSLPNPDLSLPAGLECQVRFIANP